MPHLERWLHCVGQAVPARGGAALAGAVPFEERLYAIAADALARLRDRLDEGAQRQALRELIRAPVEQVRLLAEAVAEQLGVNDPEPVRRNLAAYLAQVPPAVRLGL